MNMKTFCIWTKGLLIPSIVLLLQICSNVAFHKTWNLCPLQSDTLRFLPRVSLEECRNKCNIRNHCKLICYRTATKLCEIHGTTTKITPCKRCVSVLHEEQTVPPIICADCNNGTTCNTTTGICEYTECSNSSFPLWNTYGNMFGNLADIGAKKITECRIPTGKSTETMCNSTGKWQANSLCDDICDSSNGILLLTEDLPILFCRRSVTQREASERCDILGGEIIKLDEAYKMDTIRQLIRSNSELRQHDYWTDGHREGPASLRDWKFSDGSKMPMIEGVFWNPLPVKEKEHCTRLRQSLDFLWNDRLCSSLVPFICQML